jgi:sodium-dependent dicarboxylate transporter 2/3/5
MLGIAYAANLGGTATLTGTGPNIVLRGEIDREFPSGPGIAFGDWLLMAFPNMLLLLTFAWGYLCLIYFKNWYIKHKQY